jgi:hypothetical protein
VPVGERAREEEMERGRQGESERVSERERANEGEIERGSEGGSERVRE